MIRRVPAAIIALIAWVGLSVQFGVTFAALGSVWATLWAIFRYFTIIANFAAAIVFTAEAVNPERVSPFLRAWVTITMLLVGIVYNVLLRGMAELSGGAEIANLLNHIVTPITVTLFWCFLAEKGRLGWRAPLQWTSLPVAYFAYALVRAQSEGTYPYPFMDVRRLGWGRTMINAAVIALCFAAVGYAMLWVDRRFAFENRRELTDPV